MGWKPGNPKLFLLNILWCNPIFTSFYHLSASRRWRHNRRTKTKVQKPNPRWFNGISGWSNGIWLFDGDLIRFSTNWDGLEIMVWKAPGDFSAFPIPWPLGVPVVTHHLPGECGPGAATIGDEVRQTFGGRIFSRNLEEDREQPAQQPFLSKLIIFL